MPGFDVVGLPDASVKESRERVRSALRNSGMEYPVGHYTINLAPADMKKEGPSFDLPIAVGVLVCAEAISQSSLDGVMMSGELALSGAAFCAVKSRAESGCTTRWLHATNTCNTKPNTF